MCLTFSLVIIQDSFRITHDHGGHANVASDHNLVHGLDLKQTDVIVTVGRVNTLKVSALHRVEEVTSSGRNITQQAKLTTDQLFRPAF